MFALLCCGLTDTAVAQVLLEAGSEIRYLANSADPGIGLSWTMENYQGESSWNIGSYGIGYETDTAHNAPVALYQRGTGTRHHRC